MRLNAIQRVIRRPGPTRSRGQSLAEFALVFPFLVALLFSIIVFGLYIFYNQQLENAGREAARYAAVHSTRAQCPTVSRLDPILSNTDPDHPILRCDAPEKGWTKMVGEARSSIFGMPSNQVGVSACWSGFVDPTGQHDALPEYPNLFEECTIGGVNPRTDPDSLACPPPAAAKFTGSPPTSGDDKASALAYANGIHYPTTITVYACYEWSPPLAGFVVIPNTITVRAVVTEALQRQ